MTPNIATTDPEIRYKYPDIPDINNELWDCYPSEQTSGEGQTREIELEEHTIRIDVDISDVAQRPESGTLGPYRTYISPREVSNPIPKFMFEEIEMHGSEKQAHRYIRTEVNRITSDTKLAEISRQLQE